ncbi:uncharacterized protein CXorf21 isoform X2 [Takifugu rubripes]|uniref:uncharacterized protein CXorf21 isoform X2 n=1 Tax=Takifugu rubripes TaxID=31033 RepID=UPI0011456CAB|nr:uncharacterized protein CXorf21 homolog isoform X2 [Takifugu rubripes]
MLCEGRLWSMLYGELGEVDPLPSRDPLQRTRSRVPEQTGGADSRDASPLSYSSPLLSLNQYSPPPDLQIAPLIEIQAQARSDGAPPFLLPSFCQSICQDYSDLQIGAVEDSPPLHTSHGGLLNPLRGGSNRWRLGSTRERSFLFHNRDGPHSNSLLNRYLEQKLMDLYQQYMMENIAREEEPQAGPICPLLGSEMVLTSIDQITLQLSREGNLEAGLAKDMVLSCLLRVAGDKQSSEISTPFLQISSESSKEKLTENEDE